MIDTNFEPIELALTLPKGYAQEYRDRPWFDQIYFSKLSMSHEKEGLLPVLYQFSFEHLEDGTSELPQQLLMTFYYPQKRRMSNLNGIVIIGGQPDIYDTYRTTVELTPNLEALLLDKHPNIKKATVKTIDAILHQLSHPTTIRPIDSIIKKSVGKSEEALASFFPILTQESDSELILPMDFGIDGIFVFKIDGVFFEGDSMGKGVNTLQIYHTKDSNRELRPTHAFSLVIKWQPIYNDILLQLKDTKNKILSDSYHGRLKPNVVVFKDRDSNRYTALISQISRINDQLFYHVAMASSNHPKGQPLSLLQAQLSREKFGLESWVKRVNDENIVPEDSIRERDVSADLISMNLKEVVRETSLTDEDNKFDLGKLQAIELEDHQS